MPRSVRPVRSINNERHRAVRVDVAVHLCEQVVSGSPEGIVRAW